MIAIVDNRGKIDFYHSLKDCEHDWMPIAPEAKDDPCYRAAIMLVAEQRVVKGEDYFYIPKVYPKVYPEQYCEIKDDGLFLKIMDFNERVLNFIKFMHDRDIPQKEKK